MRIPESSEDDFKTDGPDNEVTELNERVESLGKEVRRLRKRRRQDNEDRGSKTAHVDETTLNDKNDVFYDPTKEFQNPTLTNVVVTHNILTVVPSN